MSNMLRNRERWHPAGKGGGRDYDYDYDEDYDYDYDYGEDEGGCSHSGNSVNSVRRTAGQRALDFRQRIADRMRDGGRVPR